MFPETESSWADNGDADSPMVSDPRNGGMLQWKDARAEFERLTRLQPRDLAAERAFIESRIEMIRQDPSLSEGQKATAIKLLRGE